MRQPLPHPSKAKEPEWILYYFQKRIGGWGILGSLVIGIVASYIFYEFYPPNPNNYGGALFWGTFDCFLVSYPFISCLLSAYYYSFLRGKPSDHISHQELETIDRITPQEFDAYFIKTATSKHIHLGFMVGVWLLFWLNDSGELGMYVFPIIHFWTGVFMKPILGHYVFGLRKFPARLFRWKGGDCRPMRRSTHIYNGSKSDYLGVPSWDRIN